jgi:hypothetical protein
MAKFDFDRKLFYPASSYWNALKREVYCGPEHSLEAMNG